jgi:hypothetical protein
MCHKVREWHPQVCPTSRNPGSIFRTTRLRAHGDLSCLVPNRCIGAVTIRGTKRVIMGWRAAIGQAVHLVKNRDGDHPPGQSSGGGRARGQRVCAAPLSGLPVMVRPTQASGIAEEKRLVRNRWNEEQSQCSLLHSDHGVENSDPGSRTLPGREGGDNEGGCSLGEARVCARALSMSQLKRPLVSTLPHILYSESLPECFRNRPLNTARGGGRQGSLVTYCARITTCLSASGACWMRTHRRTRS